MQKSSGELAPSAMADSMLLGTTTGAYILRFDELSLKATAKVVPRTWENLLLIKPRAAVAEINNYWRTREVVLWLTQEEASLIANNKTLFQAVLTAGREVKNTSFGKLQLENDV